MSKIMDELSNIQKIAIIGVGLIGGSFGMALKERGLAKEVIGIGRNPQRLQRGVELRALDSWTTDLESGVRDADLIFIATPVGLELDFIIRAASCAKPGCIITDAGSTKAEICRNADTVVPEGVYFIGGHPMAGSEAVGVESARSDLFINATYILTPTGNTEKKALGIIRDLAEGIGSKVITMHPESHDKCVSVISHLPHLLAASLVLLAKEISGEQPQIFDLIAGSFRDMTRVAGSSPELWRDICITNVENIENASESFKRLLDEAVQMLQAGDAERFKEWFSKAKDIRDNL